MQNYRPPSDSLLEITLASTRARHKRDRPIRRRGFAACAWVLGISVLRAIDRVIARATPFETSHVLSYGWNLNLLRNCEHLGFCRYKHICAAPLATFPYLPLEQSHDESIE